MDGDPLAGLDDDLAMHRAFVEDRDPVYARTLDLLIPRIEGDLAERLRDAWREREFGPFYERPLMILTALREDVLHEGEGHPLWAGVGASDPDPGAVTAEGVETGFAADRDRVWRSLATRFVQTNDTSRGVAWMWPAALSATVEPDRPIEIYDMGASAGLNLVADRLEWIWSDVTGAAVGPQVLPPIAARRGFDLRPLDLLDGDDERWLRALIWPGQRERRERFEQGLDAFRELAAAGELTPIETASVDDAASELEPCRVGAPRGLAYQTIMHDYLPAEIRARYDEAMREWLARSEPGSAVWVEFEIAEGGEDAESVVALTAHVAAGGGDRTAVIARSSPHPRVLRTDDGEVAALRQLLTAGG
ncbi:MAG: DUF2332 family protein [Solirubrobacterales bacterium]